jgi:predicted kinase
MTERESDLALLHLLEQDIKRVERQIIEYPPDADDENFNFLLRKARRYQEWIERLKEKLKMEEP